MKVVYTDEALRVARMERSEIRGQVLSSAADPGLWDREEAVPPSGATRKFA